MLLLIENNNINNKNKLRYFIYQNIKKNLF